MIEVNGTTSSISRRHPFHGEERIIQFSTETFEYEKYTGRIEQEVTTQRMRRVVAIVDGEHYPPVVRAALEEIDDVVVAAVLVGGTEKLSGDGEDLRRPARAVASRRPSSATRPTSCSTSPTSPCSGRASDSRSRAARWRWASRTKGPDFRFDPPAAEPVEHARRSR